MTTASQMQDSIDKSIEDFRSVNLPFKTLEWKIHKRVSDLFKGMALGDYDRVRMQFERTNDSEYKVALTHLEITRTIDDGSNQHTTIIDNDAQKLIGPEATNAVLTSEMESLIVDIGDREYDAFLQYPQLDIWRVKRDGYVMYKVFYFPLGDEELRHGILFIKMDQPEPTPTLNGGW